VKQWTSWVLTASFTLLGNPAEMIVRYGAENQCNQTVIEPRKPGTVEGLLLSSVASKVMQRSNTSVHNEIVIK